MIDAFGDIYIGDSANRRVREVTLDGNIQTVAGNGLFRYSGEGRPATSATLFRPSSVAFDKTGNMYIAEPEQARVWKVSPSGIITTFAGTGEQGYNGDKIPATSAKLWFPTGVATDSSGDVYIADEVNFILRKVTPDGIISNFLSNLDDPQAVVVDPAGNLYIAETETSIVQKVTPAGVISIYAGTGTSGFSGDGAQATSAMLNGPSGLGLDLKGNLYIADELNNRIRKVTPQGIISTVAGNGKEAFAGDGGPATSASLDNPDAVITDAAGNVYIGDLFNFRVREVTPDGVIQTIAGASTGQFSGDGGPAIMANITGPIALAFDAAGDLIVVDWLNHRVRAILVAPPTFQTSPSTLTFSAESDGLPAPVQTVQVAGSIPGILFGTAVTPQDSAPWLQVTPLQGLMPGGAQVTADPTGLAPGIYHAIFNAVTPYAQPIVRTAPVTFTVTPARPAHLAAKPDGLSFALVQKAPSAIQTLTVSEPGRRIARLHSRRHYRFRWNLADGVSGQRDVHCRQLDRPAGDGRSVGLCARDVFGRGDRRQLDYGRERHHSSRHDGQRCAADYPVIADRPHVHGSGRRRRHAGADFRSTEYRTGSYELVGFLFSAVRPVELALGNAG